MSTLKQLFGFGPKTDYSQLVKNGAVIIDVRTKEEYRQGHVKGSHNIPLNTLSDNCSKWGKDKAIITCCASGMRSAQAKSILESKGYTEVYNGGGWSSLNAEIK